MHWDQTHRFSSVCVYVWKLINAAINCANSHQIGYVFEIALNEKKT